MFLPPNQIQFLCEYLRVTTETPDPSTSFTSVRQLLDPIQCEQYLQTITKHLNTSSLIVAASQFAKRYAFFTVLPTLYTMSIYHKGLPIEVSNSYIHSAYEQDRWLPKLALQSWEVTEPGSDRGFWREQVVRKLFRDNITPLWTVLSKTSGIQPSILWENTMVYIDWMYRKQIQDADVEKDFDFLINQANPELFGGDFQPLKKYPTPNGCRKTCCLFFMTNEEQRLCKGCPRNRIRSPRIHSVVSS